METVYPLCQGSTRSQDGQCLDDQQFETICKERVGCSFYMGYILFRPYYIGLNTLILRASCLLCYQVCDTEGDFISVDYGLSLCVCATDDLEALCNLQCRRAQRDTLGMYCPDAPEEPYIGVKEFDGTISVSH